MCIHVCVRAYVYMHACARMCVCFCVFRGFHCLLCSVSCYIITWCFGLASIKKKKHTHKLVYTHAQIQTEIKCVLTAAVQQVFMCVSVNKL